MPTDLDIFARDLARVHEVAFTTHADRLAPGVLRLLTDHGLLEGTVVEVGAGTGALTRHLVAAGLDVVATDAAPSMLVRLKAAVPGVRDTRVLVLPDDPVPSCDVVISVGHVLNYLDDSDAARRAVRAAVAALRPGGLLVMDVCDLTWGQTRSAAETVVREGDGWWLETVYSLPRPDTYVRDMTIRMSTPTGTRQSRGRHVNRLFDLYQLVAELRADGVPADLHDTLGGALLPPGMLALIGGSV